MWNRIQAIFWKEFLQLKRDRLTLVFIVIMPLMQLVIFGLAVNTDVKHLPAVIYDESRSQESRDFVAGLVMTQYFDLKDHVDSEASLREAIDGGRAQVGVWFPPDYTRRIRAGKTGEVFVIVDASNPTTAGNAMATAVGVANLRNSSLLFDRQGVGPATRPPMPIEVRVRPWYNPELRSPVFIVPGLVCVILSMTCIIFASAGLVREKERGTLDQIMVTPVRPFELFLGKTLPYVVIAYFQLTLMFLAARFLFRVPIMGSIPLLYLCAAIYILPMLGIGMRISTVAQTQGQATQMAFLALLPMIFLSGYIFPIEGMPTFFQWLSEVIPLTHFLLVVRGIVLRGVGVASFWLPLCKLVVMTAIIWGITLRSLRRATA